MLDASHRVVENLERWENALPLDSIDARILAAPRARYLPMFSFSLVNQDPTHVGGRAQRRRRRRLRRREGFCLWRIRPAHTRTALTTLFSRVGDTEEMLLDGLTNILPLMEGYHFYDASCGALGFAPGGVETAKAYLRGLWRVLTSAIN